MGEQAGVVKVPAAAGIITHPIIIPGNVADPVVTALLPADERGQAKQVRGWFGRRGRSLGAPSDSRCVVAECVGCLATHGDTIAEDCLVNNGAR